MLTVEDAWGLIGDRVRELPARAEPLRACAGRVLAEDVAADLDLPPFDKALMDGFAVRSADLADAGPHRLRVVAEIHAGQTPLRALDRGETVAIMTGAPLPEGADAVVQLERVETQDDGTILFPGPIRPGQNRLVRGREMRVGEVALGRGEVLNAPKLGLLASVGRAAVRVIPRPEVAVVSTGDELVPYSQVPGPGQIRGSNEVTLAALAEGRGARVRTLPIAPDEPEALRAILARALDGDPPGEGPADVVLISGGVSAGARDLVPAALEALGVVRVFHKVRVKPGKPLWFGVGPDRDGRPGALVFGLPGNPVSGVVGFLLFVGPALDRLAGRGSPGSGRTEVRLAVPFAQRGDRPTFHPARWVAGGSDGDRRIEPLDWAGSADLRTVARADGFAAFPAGEHDFAAGDAVPFLPLT